MCILIAKPKGAIMPTESVLKTCWENNPDGAGIAWSMNGKVFIEKGFMTWDELKEYISKNSLDSVSALIHFRIATHGTVRAENTHPFVVNSEIAAAHNGVLSIKNEGDWTDSETFFKRICNPVLENYSLDSKVFKKLIEATIGSSKLAFINNKGRITMFGNFIKDNGVYYSNSSYKEYELPAYYGYSSKNYPLYGSKKYSKYGCSYKAGNTCGDEMAYPYDDWEDNVDFYSEAKKVGRDNSYEISSDDVQSFAVTRRWDIIFKDGEYDYNTIYAETDALIASYKISYESAMDIIEKYIEGAFY